MKPRKPKPHVSLTEVASLHRQASRMKRAAESPQALELLDEALESCPAYVPALLLAGRRLQTSASTGPAEKRAGLRKARRYLQQAVLASDRSAASLVELGYFLHAAEGDSDAAERYLLAGVEKALTVLEDGWSGLIDVLYAQGRLEEAAALGQRAQHLFPDSVRIATALTPVMAALPPPKPPRAPAPGRRRGPTRR
jgi:tetratricopeptide (TPR) repeat protein